jgi:hypothetical protein
MSDLLPTEQKPMPEPKQMTKEEAIEFFSILFFGEHHIPSDVKPFGRGWKVSAHSMATYDHDELTRLVFLAHDRCVRVEIVPSGPGRIGLAISKRHGRNGSMYSRHPSIKCALVNWRMKHSAPADGADE